MFERVTIISSIDYSLRLVFGLSLWSVQRGGVYVLRWTNYVMWLWVLKRNGESDCTCWGMYKECNLNTGATCLKFRYRRRLTQRRRKPAKYINNALLQFLPSWLHIIWGLMYSTLSKSHWHVSYWPLIWEQSQISFWPYYWETTAIEGYFGDRMMFVSGSNNLMILVYGSIYYEYFRHQSTLYCQHLRSNQLWLMKLYMQIVTSFHVVQMPQNLN